MLNPFQGVKRAIRDGRDKITHAGDNIRGLADEMRGMTGAPQETPGDASDSTFASHRSSLTSEETLAYQNREIAKELWALEKHLSQGCRIPNKDGVQVPCDCCEKGSFIAGLAQEAIPISERSGQPSAVYEKIAGWCEGLDPMVAVEAVESGQWDYKKLSGEASALRKELMGTASLKAMITPSAG